MTSSTKNVSVSLSTSRFSLLNQTKINVEELLISWANKQASRTFRRRPAWASPRSFQTASRTRWRSTRWHSRIKQADSSCRRSTRTRTSTTTGTWASSKRRELSHSETVPSPSCSSMYTDISQLKTSCLKHHNCWQITYGTNWLMLVTWFLRRPSHCQLTQTLSKCIRAEMM